MTCRIVIAWYDMWIGVYWDAARKRLYILPIPCVGIVLDFGGPRLPFGLADGRVEEEG